MKTLSILSVALMTIISCSPNSEKSIETTQSPQLKTGIYRFEINLDPEILPFTATLSQDDDKTYLLEIHNGEESIIVNNVTCNDDSIVFHLPVFQSEFRAKIESPDFFSGIYINYNKEIPLKLPFVAEFHKDFRFTSTASSLRLSSRFKVDFVETDGESTPAVLIVDNSQGKLEATFLTETGDYRFLAGNIMNNKLFLSTFDGAHAFYFEADIDGDNLINGVFKSGNTYCCFWQGLPNKDFELRDPKTLTYMKEGYSEFDFNLPNENGDYVSWKDLNLDGKVVIVDIMGSWCPNCMDASLALHQLREPYTQEELIILPIAFELTADIEIAKKRVFKMQENLGLPRGFIFGGYADKEHASAQLPALNHIMSFPTIIVVGKDRRVELIYTGFYGPGTGAYNDEFMQNTSNLISKLIAE